MAVGSSVIGLREYFGKTWLKIFKRQIIFKYFRGVWVLVDSFEEKVLLAGDIPAQKAHAYHHIIIRRLHP